MSELLNRSAYKKAILSKAESEGKRVIDPKTGKVEKGIKIVSDDNFVEANRVLRELISRTIAMAHPTKPTVHAPIPKEQIVAMGLGPRKRKRA